MPTLPTAAPTTARAIPDGLADEICRYVASCEDLFSGNCGVFAIALWQRYGGAVVASCVKALGRTELFGAIDHAAWRSPSGQLFDGSGRLPAHKLHADPRAGAQANPFALVEISALPGFIEATLRATCPSLSVAEMTDYIVEAEQACSPAEEWFASDRAGAVSSD